MAAGGNQDNQWEEDASWGDSERFDEDSLGSWDMSDSESMTQNWRGWSGPGRSGGGTNANNFVFSPSYTGGIQHGSVQSGSGAGCSSSTSRQHNAASNARTNVPSLLDAAARVVVQTMTFDQMETYVANYAQHEQASGAGGGGWIGALNEEHVQRRLAFFCFPQHEEDIRLYSCLANGNADEFHKGEQLYRAKAVKDLMQIGFHLSATVVCSAQMRARWDARVDTNGMRQLTQTNTNNAPHKFKVAVTIDRCKITSCSCDQCSSETPSWCAHVVAMCLQRIYQPIDCQFRATLSESLGRLHTPHTLRKFALYLIHDLPREFLPIAQRLLDQCLDKDSELSQLNGAPDPTADTCIDEVAGWCLHDRLLGDNIKKILHKFCVPSPTVMCDVNYLSTNNQPAVAAEWQALLRPLRSREPEGLWNLLSIVREMYRRHDVNATKLLHIITEKCLAFDQVVLWWYQTKLAHSGAYPICSTSLMGGRQSGLASNHQNAQYSCASLLDEIVQLWRLVALNPCLPPVERALLAEHLKQYHKRVVEKAWTVICHAHDRGNNVQAGLTPAVPGFGKLTPQTASFDMRTFVGFADAVAACYVKVCSDETEPCALWIECNTLGTGTSPNGEPLTLVDSTLCGARRSPFSPQATLPILKDITHAQQSSSSAVPVPMPDSACSSKMSVTHPHTHYLPMDQHYPHAQAQSPHRRVLNVPDDLQPPSSPESGQGSASPSPHVSNRDQYFVMGPVTPVAVLNEARSASPEHVDVKAAQLEHAMNMYLAQGPEPHAQAQENPAPIPTNLVLSSPANEVSAALDKYATDMNENMTDLNWWRCEALDAHGFTLEAGKFARRLALQLLDCPPQLMAQVPPPHQAPQKLTPSKHSSTGKRKKKAVNGLSGGTHTNEHHLLVPDQAAVDLSVLTVRTLQRVLYLFEVLMKPSTPRTEEPQTVDRDNEYDFDVPGRDRTLTNRQLAFRIALWAIEQARRPAATKFMEMQLHHLEMHILAELRKLTLNVQEMMLVREAAKRLAAMPQPRDAQVLPFSLASYITDILLHQCNTQAMSVDGKLAFDAALNALSLKCTVSEQEHPLLCEGTRRHRTDLALTLMVRHKDALDRLAQIMERVLDSSMHRMYSHSSSNALYYYAHHRIPQTSTSATTNTGDTQAQAQSLAVANQLESISLKSGARSSTDGEQGCSSNQLSRDTSPRSSVLTTTSEEVHDTAALDTDNPGPSGVNPKRIVETNAKSSRRVRSAPSQPNQPSEAHAHCMTELAKRMLTEAGGSHSTSIYNAALQPAAAVPHEHGLDAMPLAQQNAGTPSVTHRHLHMCAFQIGLYALGLHNQVTPNWPSRTYSAHVSWITGQAIEIGRSAVRILIDTWHNHLTPAEVAGLADKASQGRETSMVCAAAELALSALADAQALNPNEIQRALVQCREQNIQMLEKACLAVESAAKKDYGVDPVTLFKVARRWFDLYQEQERHSNLASVHTQPAHPVSVQQAQTAHSVSVSQAPAAAQYYTPQPALFNLPHTHMAMPPPPPAQVNRSLVFMNMPPPVPVTSGQGTGAPNQMYNQQQHLYANMMLRPGVYPQQHGVYPPTAHQHQQQQMQYMQQQQQAQYNRSLHSSQSAPNLAQQHNGLMPPVVQAQGMLPPNQPHTQAQPQSVIMRRHGTSTNTAAAHTHTEDRLDTNTHGAGSKHLVSAYRVGMLAMDTMGRRSNDDRSYIKFSQNPPYGDDVKWLFSIAQKLGAFYAYQFCLSAAQSVVSPFVLNELAVEALRLFPAGGYATGGASGLGLHNTGNGASTAVNMTTAQHNHSNVQVATTTLSTTVQKITTSGQLSPPALHLLVRCLQMFYTAAHQKLSHPRFQASDMEEVSKLVHAAKLCFHTQLQHDLANKLFEDYVTNHMLRQKAASKRDVRQKIQQLLR